MTTVEHEAAGNMGILTRSITSILLLTSVGFPTNSSVWAVTRVPGFPAEPSQLGPVDVALTSPGILRGRILGQDGRARRGAEILLLDASGRLTRVRADDSGRFAACSLQGGVYQIMFGDSCTLVRAWAPGTAPPGALKQVTLMPIPPVVRAQWTPSPVVNNTVRAATVAMSKPAIAGSVLAASVGIPVLVHNLTNDDAPMSP